MLAQELLLLIDTSISFRVFHKRQDIIFYKIKKVLTIMSAINLDRVFNPKQIAVVGFDQKESVIDSTNLYKKTICNLCTYPFILNIEYPVDLVILCSSLETASHMIKECVSVGADGR